MKDLFVQILKHSDAIQYVIGFVIAVVVFAWAVKHDNRIQKTNVR